MNQEERLKTVWKDGKWHWADTGEAVNEGSPLQRLSELVNEARGIDWPDFDEHGDAMVVAGCRVIRFLCSPEAVEVLEEVINRARREALIPAPSLADLWSRQAATACLNTIAEQALKEPSNG